MKLYIGFLLIFVANMFADARPAVPGFQGDSLIDNKHKCKVPDFLINIPPMMEPDYIECVNKRSQPSKKLVEVVLKQQVSKKAEFLGIEPAERFYTRVYRISYKIGDEVKKMICNDKMTYCLDDKPIVTRER